MGMVNQAMAPRSPPDFVLNLNRARRRKLYRWFICAHEISQVSKQDRGGLGLHSQWLSLERLAAAIRRSVRASSCADIS
jgi:hypothetical protein